MSPLFQCKTVNVELTPFSAQQEGHATTPAKVARIRGLPPVIIGNHELSVNVGCPVLEDAAEIKVGQLYIVATRDTRSKEQRQRRPSLMVDNTEIAINRRRPNNQPPRHIGFYPFSPEATLICRR